MKVLVLNCGSSTLKFQLIEASTEGTASAAVRPLARGRVDRIGGGDSTLALEMDGTAAQKEPSRARNHEEAVRAIIALLKSDSKLDAFNVVAHRVVHGGDRFRSAVLIDDSVMDALEILRELAPLHNPPSLAGIRAARSDIGKTMPMVAVFDTSFHRTIPESAATYAIPHE
ncbi:MAG: hypothetical protein WD688_09235, partial [Candidatus Binatia bacterium]